MLNQGQIDAIVYTILVMIVAIIYVKSIKRLIKNGLFTPDHGNTICFIILIIAIFTSAFLLLVKFNMIP